MADNFQLDEIPIPRAAPVEAQLAPIVQNTEWQARQAQARVEEPPKAWGMPGAGFAGKGAGAANIADSILRGLIAGKTAAALTMAKQTMAEVGTATQRHRVNEESYRNAKLATMDPTTMENPEARDKAAAALATAEQNLRDSQNMMLQVYGKHAGLTERKPGQKEGGIGSKIVRGMAGAFKAKDPTSAAIQIAYSMMPAGEDMPMPAIDPLAATKARILGTAAKGGEQQLEVGKQQLALGAQKLEAGKFENEMLAMNAEQIREARSYLRQFDAVGAMRRQAIASGRPATDPQVRILDAERGSLASGYAARTGRTIPSPSAFDAEEEKNALTIATSQEGRKYLQQRGVAMEKAARGEKLAAFDQMLVGMRPENVFQAYWQSFGGDAGKAAERMHADALQIANVGHQANGYAYLYKAARIIEDDNWKKAGNTGPAPEANVARHFEQIDRPQAFKVPTRTFTEGDKQRTLSSYLAQVFRVQPEWGKYGFASGTMGKGTYDTVLRRPTPDIGTMPWNEGEVKNAKELADYDEFYGTLLSLARSQYDQARARGAEAQQRGQDVDIKQIPPSPSELGLVPDLSQTPPGGTASQQREGWTPPAGSTAPGARLYRITLEGKTREVMLQPERAQEYQARGAKVEPISR